MTRSLAHNQERTGNTPDGNMNQYVLEFTTPPTPAFLQALQRDFCKVICINDSIWMNGEPDQERKILNHAAATGVRLSFVVSSSTAHSDDTWKTTTIVTKPTTSLG